MKYLVGFLVAIGLLAGATTAYGAFSPSGGGTYRLGSSVGTSNSTVKLSSFKEPVSNIAYTMTYLGSDIGYGTIDPQTTRSEFVSFSGITQNSDGSALLTGVTRGLTRTPAGASCTASTTLAQAHPGQSVFILSDSPCLFAEYLPARTNATSSASLVFTNTYPPHYNAVGAQGSGSAFATTSEFASVAFVNATAIAGATNASEVLKGIGELSTGLEAASSTLTGGTGASLLLYSKYATSSPFTTGNFIPVTQINGKLESTFINQAQAYSWTALHTYTGGLFSNSSTTIVASNLTTNALNLRGIPYSAPANITGSSTILCVSSLGAMSWCSQGSRILDLNPFNNVSTALTATTTLKTISIPASAVNATTQAVRINGTLSAIGSGADCYFQLDIGTGSATTTLGYAAARNLPGGTFLTSMIYATSTTAQMATTFGADSPQPATAISAKTWANTAFTSVNLAAQWYIAFSAKQDTAGSATCKLIGDTVEILSQ